MAQPLIWNIYVEPKINKKLKVNGWDFKIENSSINFFGTTQLKNVIASHKFGSVVNIEKLSFNLGIFSSIFDVKVLDLLTVEGFDALYVADTNSVKTDQVENLMVDIPYHIKSFFIDGRFTSNINGEDYTFNVISGGDLNGKENPVLNFDLVKIFLEKNINLDCHFNQMALGHNGKTYFLKDIKGEFINQPISGNLFFDQNLNKVNGTLDLINFTIPKDLFSLLPLKTKFSNFNGKLKFESDFELFSGELVLDNQLGLDMNGKFLVQKKSNAVILKNLELIDDKSNLKMNGLWQNNERISCFMNLNNFDLSRWINNQKPTQISGLFIMDANLTDDMALNQINMTLEMVEAKLFNQGEISIHGLLTYADSTLSTLDPVMLLVGDSYLTIDGMRNFSSNKIELFIDMEKADIELVNNFLPGDFVSGKATGKLKASGKINSPSVLAELTCDNVNISNFQLKTIELTSQITVSDTVPSGFIDIKAGQGMWKNRSFESGTVNATLENKSVIIENCHFKSGNDFLQASGTFNGEYLYKVDRIQLAYQNNYLVNARPIQFSLTDSILQVNPFEFHINDGMMEGVISGSDHMKGQFKMSNFDAEILTEFINDKRLKLSGLIFGEIQVLSKGENLDLDVDVSLKKGKYMSEPFDEMVLSCFYKDGILHLDDISMTREGLLGINAQGIIPIVNNNVNYNTIALKSNFFNMPLEFVHRFIPEFFKIEGMATGNFDLKGTPEKTQFYYNLEIDKTVFDLVEMGSLSSQGHYDGYKLFIDKANSKLNNGNISASGIIPFDLNIGSEYFGSLFRKDSINFQVNAKIKSLPFLSPYISDLDSASGDFLIELSLTGEAGNITRNGKILIDNGILYTLLLSDPIQSIHGSATMRNNLLNITELSAMLYHPNGKYEKPKTQNTFVKGSIDFKEFFDPNYNLGITSNNSSFKLLPFDISGQSNLDLFINGQDTVGIEGTIETQNANIFYEFSTEDVGTAIIDEESTIMLYNINIPIRGKAFFQNSQIDAELIGDLNLSQVGHQEMDFGGQIIVEDGFLFFYKDKFQNLNGIVSFDNKGFNPSINIGAYTTIDDERIDLRIIGGINDLDIILESSSSFSESDILELLFLGKRLEDQALTTSTGFGNQTVSILGALLENQLEKNLKESNTAMMNYVDDINISGAAGLLQGTNEDFEVTAEKKIGNKTFLNLSYKRSFSLNQDQSQVGVEYKLNRHFSVVGNVDEDGNLNFKYRYKYAY